MGKIGMLLVLVVTAALAAGCGATQQGGQGAQHGHAAGMADRGTRGSAMSGMEMAGMRMKVGSSNSTPSAAARMICSEETGDAVKRTFGLDAAPPRRQMWMPPVYGCTWTLPHSALDLAVDDEPHPAQGRKGFAQMKAGTPGARELRGMASLGFPAFQSAAGMVVFLKDGKVLSVDATAVARRDLPHGFSREDAAYGVASAVIACWSE
jgi:hypothetical protein